MMTLCLQVSYIFGDGDLFPLKSCSDHLPVEGLVMPSALPSIVQRPIRSELTFER